MKKLLPAIIALIAFSQSISAFSRDIPTSVAALTPGQGNPPTKQEPDMDVLRWRPTAPTDKIQSLAQLRDWNSHAYERSVARIVGAEQLRDSAIVEAKARMGGTIYLAFQVLQKKNPKAAKAWIANTSFDHAKNPQTSHFKRFQAAKKKALFLYSIAVADAEDAYDRHERMAISIQKFEIIIGKGAYEVAKQSTK